MHRIFTTSITAYFAATFTVTVLSGVALYHLFIGAASIGDDDDRPSRAQLVQASRLAGIVRMLDAAPHDMRKALAKAAGSDDLRVQLFDASSATDDGAPRPGRCSDILGAASAANATRVPPVDDNTMFVSARATERPSCETQLLDRSTVALRGGDSVVFTSATPAWDFERSARIILRLVVASTSIALVSFLGARWLARPVDAFAQAAHRFGTDPNAPAMLEQGPTEMRAAIVAFNTMQMRIRRLVSGQNAMFAAISHDLRTPLTRMRLRGEFIADQQQQARLFRDVDDMQSMVDAALAFLRDNAAEEETTNLDLAELLRTIADDHADMGTEVPYRGPDHRAFLGRPVGLKRAFANLVDNAVRYGVKPKIDLHQEDASIIVSISDDGPGIPREALEDVFTPFRRVEQSRNRETGGIGLGLTAARAGFRAHGGDVMLANGEAGGLVATVTLPIAR